MNRIQYLFLALLFFNIPESFAAKAEAIMEVKDASQVQVEGLQDFTGNLITPNNFLKADYKTSAKGAHLPSALAAQFDQSASLINHIAFLKVPFNYESFVKEALKDKASLEHSVLYNTKIELYDEGLAGCPNLNGRIITDVNVAGLKLGNYPDKLLCNISILKTGVGKKEMTSEISSKIPEGVKDEDIRYVTLNFSECNMVFKGLTQIIYFIKMPDGKTLLAFENYSLIKNTTLDKMTSFPASLVVGDPKKFINKLVKDNFNGLSKYIQTSRK